MVDEGPEPPQPPSISGDVHYVTLITDYEGVERLASDDDDGRR